MTLNLISWSSLLLHQVLASSGSVGNQGSATTKFSVVGLSCTRSCCCCLFSCFLLYIVRVVAKVRPLIIHVDHAEQVWRIPDIVHVMSGLPSQRGLTLAMMRAGISGGSQRGLEREACQCTMSLALLLLPRDYFV